MAAKKGVRTSVVYPYLDYQRMVPDLPKTKLNSEMQDILIAVMEDTVVPAKTMAAWRGKKGGKLKRRLDLLRKNKRKNKGKNKRKKA